MRFELKAVDAGGQVLAVEFEAPDEAAAREAARQRGYAVLAASRKSTSLPWPAERKRAFPTTVFSIELLALLEAGLNIVEALQALASKAPSGADRALLTELLAALNRGESTSQAIARFPEAFSPLYVATLQSSEQTGNLPEALSRYIVYEQEIDKVRKKVLAALLYPAILIAVGTLVLLFLMFYVVPRFARVYEDISTGLPLFSSLLLSLGRSIEAHGALAVFLIAGSVGTLAYALSQVKVRASLIARAWRLPVLGERMKVYQLARLYRSVGMLLRAGIPARRSFEMVSGLLAPNLRAQLSHAAILLSEGQTISASLTSVGLATSVATHMMAVGERSGQMGELVDRIARFYDEETARFVDTATRLFEPLLMTALGLAVGLVVVLMYMPIFELAGSLN